MIAELDYRFKVPGSGTHFASDLALRLQSPIPRCEVISSESLIKDFDRDKIWQLLEGCLKFENSFIAISAREVPLCLKASYDTIEPVYGTRYVKRPMDQAIYLDPHVGIHSEYHLPRKNPFIPSCLPVHMTMDTKKLQDKPNLVHETPSLRLWRKKDLRFRMPRGQVYISLQS